MKGLQHLNLPICPKCNDTKNVKLYYGRVKMSQPYCCNECGIYWAEDQGIDAIYNNESSRSS